MPTNATVDFPNADPIYHNVFSVSGANRFDLGLYRSGAAKSKKFEEPGLVRVYCNIHPQMIGFVMVVDSASPRHRRRTAPSGSTTCPAGSHDAQGLARGRAPRSRSPSRSRPCDEPLVLRIDVSGFKAGPHKNKYGKDYKPADAGDDDG